LLSMIQLKRGSRVSIARGENRYSHRSEDAVMLGPPCAKIENAEATSSEPKKTQTILLNVALLQAAMFTKAG